MINTIQTDLTHLTNKNDILLGYGYDYKETNKSFYYYLITSIFF